MSDPRPKLTGRQALVMAFIAERIDEVGYPPTIREIGRAFGIISTNGVADHIKALARKGYISHEEGKSRTLRLVPPVPRPPGAQEVPSAANDERGPRPSRAHIAQYRHCVAVPLLGRVAAGQPILAPEEALAEEHLFVDRSWLGGADDVFALKVTGDSMIEDGILDGDTVFVRRRDCADAGDTAVVMIDSEATIKRYYPEPGRLRLQPANAAMAPIYVYPSAAHTVQVVGLVVGVYRRM